MKLNWIDATVTAAAPSETSASVRMPIGLLVRSRLMPIAMPAAVAAPSRISASCHSMFMRKPPCSQDPQGGPVPAAVQRSVAVVGGA